MFKKTKIAAATIALLGAAAAQNVSAVALDESGSNAQVLIFPYYNTNNGFSTGFNIRNTKDEYKAVKIRFRESKLSNDVLDFNVYLSPYDRVSYSVSVNGKDQASLSTTDTTCHFPAIPASGIAFKGNVYKNTVDADAREGYLEVIEMGVIPAGSLLKDGKTSITAGIKHSSAGVPADCGVIKKAWDENTFTQGGANAVVGGVNHTTVKPAVLKTPTGGLQGWSFLLDIGNGNAFVANPVSIRNYQTTWAQHYRSDDSATFLLPSLASGNDAKAATYNDTGDGAVVRTWLPATDYATTIIGQAEIKLANGGNGPTASGINPYPISHVLAATGFSNDFLVDSTANVGTDWVVTFPMRKHGIYSTVTYNPNTDGKTPATYLFETPQSGDVKMGGAFYSSEEQTSALADDFSPVSKSPLELLPREVNILSFGKSGNSAVSKVLNSSYTKNIGVDYTSGWGVVAFDTTSYTADATLNGGITNAFVAAVQGVPALGFAAIHGNVTTVPGGKTVTIGETVPHVFNRVRAVK